MKKMKKIAVLLTLVLVVCSLFSVSAFAASPEGEGNESGKLDMNLAPESFEERVEYALQGTVTGMLMVFAVLAFLTVVLYVSKYVFYDIPNRKNQKEASAPKEKKTEAKPKVEKKAPVSASVEAPAPTVAPLDDGELVAVITAAIAAMIESGDYKNEFVGGFRVVSFKRSEKNAWNRR